MKPLSKTAITVILLACSLGLAQEKQMYEVVGTGHYQTIVSGICSTSVRDVTNKKINLVLIRSKMFGGCKIPDVGTTIPGQRKGDKIKLTIDNKETEWKIAASQLDPTQENK